MSLKDDLSEKITEYLEGDYEINEIKEIPSVEDVPFGKIAKKMNLCVFYIDLRESTELLFQHQKQTAGKIHKAFLYAVSKIVRYYDGTIRSFNGDSLLAFWPARYTSHITKCVKCAMKIKWCLDVGNSHLFEKYQKLDFGIGIDWGEVYILRAGIPRDTNNNDLVFIGKCVNYAVAIGEQAKGPKHIEISSIIYSNLEDEAKYGISNDKKVDIWKDGIVNWQDEQYKTKLTSWYWEIG